MSGPAHVALVGLPGSGKSTIGRQLARRLGRPFIDTDQLIEQRVGLSIREFFEREGEESFRDLEQSVIDELTLVSHAFYRRVAGRCCGRPTASI